MARNKQGKDNSWKVHSVNSGASLDEPFFPEPDASAPPRSKGNSSHEALESFMRGGK